jgi:hypothetical protein
MPFAAVSGWSARRPRGTKRWHDEQLAQLDGLATVLASQRASGVVIAPGVEDQHLGARRAPFVALGPSHQRHHAWKQVAALPVRW